MTSRELAIAPNTQVEMTAPKILMTRRRVDRLMLMLTIGVAGVTSLVTQNPLYLPQIAIPILLWFQLRRKIPLRGILTDTIEGNARTIHLLVWLALCLVFAMLMLAVDYTITGHKIHDPVQPYHWVAFVIHFAILLFGVAWIDRKEQRVTKRIVDERTDGNFG